MSASTFPRWRDDRVPDFVLQQARALRACRPDLEIHVLAPHDAGARLEEELDGIPVTRFRYFWPARWQRLVYPAILPNLKRRPWLAFQVPFLIGAEIAALYRLSRRMPADVLYSHWFVPQGVAAGVVAWLRGIPHVFTSHSSDVQVMRRLPLLGPPLVRFFVRRMRACTVVSRRSYEKLRSFFTEREWPAIAPRVAVLPMGVRAAAGAEAGEAAALRARHGLAGKRIVLFLGRLSEKKGIPYLIEAFARIHEETADALLVIAGDGEQRAEIEARIRRSGLGAAALMPGYVSGAEKRAWLAAAEVFVVPSIVTAGGDAEGLPVALLEGLAAGKVCIASDESGADEVIEAGADGLLVRARDAAGLADALRAALALAPEKRARLGKNAKRKAERYDWAVVARAHYEHLFKSL